MKSLNWAHSSLLIKQPWQVKWVLKAGDLLLRHCCSVTLTIWIFASSSPRLALKAIHLFPKQILYVYLQLLTNSITQHLLVALTYLYQWPRRTYWLSSDALLFIPAYLVSLRPHPRARQKEPGAFYTWRLLDYRNEKEKALEQLLLTQESIRSVKDGKPSAWESHSEESG